MVSEKECRCCREVKPSSEYCKSRINKDGLYSYCLPCKRAKRNDSYSRNKNQSIQYYQENKDYISQRKKNKYQTQKEKVAERDRKYRESNKEKISARGKNYYIKNKDTLDKKSSQYAKNNLGKFRAYNAKRHATKMKQTPSWSDLKAIEEFYKNCPEGYQVDHIIPLQGKNVRGLHVLENLQYLTKTENIRKGNRYDG